LALSPCVSLTAYHACDDCDDEETCAIRKALLAARDATAAVLEARTLASAIPPAKKPRRAA
jgi:DNA-binding IscR family transcriptional regulator